MKLKVTVCQLPNAPQAFAEAWTALGAHITETGSQLLVLPEMPFYPWLAAGETFEAKQWALAVTAHDAGLNRVAELGSLVVAGSLPVSLGQRRRNEGFLWDGENGYQKAHQKVYLPNEPGFWEANWYAPGAKRFNPVELGEVTAGFMICTEMWFTEHARQFARKGLHLLLCPRATHRGSTSKWVAGGRTAAVMSGAFCLSSNRGGFGKPDEAWGGCGWIIDPEEGDVLAKTSDAEPFMTREIDLARAVAAKNTYPRYVAEK